MNAPARSMRFLRVWPGFALLALLALAQLAGCGKASPPPPLPTEVAVVKVAIAPVVVYEEYVAQTEAVDTVEIRARVGGILERQAFEDGSRVKSNDLLFVIDQQPYITALAQAKAALAQARANAINSNQNLARLKPLISDHAISQQDLDAAVAKAGADAASVEAAKAQVKQAELNLDYTTIRAPRDGMISKALVKPGGLVNASTTLLTTLYSVDPIYVNFTISERRLVELQKTLKRNPGEDKTRAPRFFLRLVDGSEYQHSGRLNFVDAAVDPKSGTLQVRLSVPNPDRALRPGQFLRVIVPAVETTSGIRVPQKAVQELQGKRSVFVVGTDNKVAYREIAARTRVENDWLVEDGLRAGDVVIVEGVNKVKPGATVKPVMVAATGTGTGTGSGAGSGSPPASAPPAPAPSAKAGS